MTHPEPDHGLDGPLSVEQAASYLGVGVRTVWRWRERGILTGRLDVGPGGRRQVWFGGRELATLKAKQEASRAALAAE